VQPAVINVVTDIEVTNAGYGRGHRRGRHREAGHRDQRAADAAPGPPRRARPARHPGQQIIGLQNGAIGWHNTGPAGQKASEDGRRGLSRDRQLTAVTR
jgi:hypothetical protein